MYQWVWFIVCIDVEVMECLLRPYIVKASNLTLSNVGVALDVDVEADLMRLDGCVPGSSPDEGSVVTRPAAGSTASLGTHVLWTAQPANKIPGHTGYLTSATLH